MMIMNILTIFAFALNRFSIASLFACLAVLLFRARHVSQYTTPINMLGTTDIYPIKNPVYSTKFLSLTIAFSDGQQTFPVNWCRRTYGILIAIELVQIKRRKADIVKCDGRGDSGRAMILKLKLSNFLAISKLENRLYHFKVGL